MKQLIVTLIIFPLVSQCQNLYKEHVPRQPYTKYVLHQNNSTDSISFYLSEFSASTCLPLIVYIQGSGNASLFKKDDAGYILPTSGHISWAYEAEDKAKLLIIEKPGINYLNQNETNPAFDKLFSLESWAKRIETTIRFIISKEKIDTTRMMIAGHSEGGIVAARVAKEMNGSITHVSILAGEGPSQLYSLYAFAESGVFFNASGFTAGQRIDSLQTVWKNILADPLSVEKKFWRFTYLRWSTFLKTSVFEELATFNRKVLVMQGDEDKNVSPESAKFLYTSLLSKGKKVTLEMIRGADHSFNIESNKEIDGWAVTIKKSIDWFLK